MQATKGPNYGSLSKKNSKILKSLTINKEETNQLKYRKGSLVK